MGAKGTEAARQAGDETSDQTFSSYPSPHPSALQKKLFKRVKVIYDPLRTALLKFSLFSWQWRWSLRADWSNNSSECREMKSGRRGGIYPPAWLTPAGWWRRWTETQNPWSSDPSGPPVWKQKKHHNQLCYQSSAGSSGDLSVYSLFIMNSTTHSLLQNLDLPHS